MQLEDAGCPQGTTILVRDLFYNVPARMKFLKKDVSEGNAVAGVVDRIALSHPEISVRFIREGREEPVSYTHLDVYKRQVHTRNSQLNMRLKYTIMIQIIFPIGAVVDSDVAGMPGKSLVQPVKNHRLIGKLSQGFTGVLVVAVGDNHPGSTGGKTAEGGNDIFQRTEIIQMIRVNIEDKMCIRDRRYALQYLPFLAIFTGYILTICFQSKPCKERCV